MITKLCEMKRKQRNQLAVSLIVLCILVTITIVVAGVIIKVVLSICKHVPPVNPPADTNNVSKVMSQEITTNFVITLPSFSTKGSRDSAGSTNFVLGLESTAQLDLGQWNTRYYLTGQISGGVVSMTASSTNMLPFYVQGAIANVLGTNQAIINIPVPEWTDDPNQPSQFFRLKELRVESGTSTN